MENDNNKLSLLRWKYLFYLLILPLIWWIWHTISFGDVGKAIGNLTVWRVFILLLISALLVLVFTFRWWMIIRFLGHPVSFARLVPYRLAGIGLSYFTPGPQIGGEPFQAYLLKGKEEIPGSTAVASVVLDKLFETLTKFGFISLGAFAILHLQLFPQSVHSSTLIIAGLLILLPGGIFIALIKKKLPFNFFLRKLPESVRKKTLVSRIVYLIAESESRMSEFFTSSPNAFIVINSISLLGWITLLFEFWLSLFFLGANFNFWEILSALTVARVAFLLPIPAGLGALEASQVLILSALGETAALGLAVSLVIRARDVLYGALGILTAYFLTGTLLVKQKSI